MTLRLACIPKYLKNFKQVVWCILLNKYFGKISIHDIHIIIILSSLPKGAVTMVFSTKNNNDN